METYSFYRTALAVALIVGIDLFSVSTAAAATPTPAFTLADSIQAQTRAAMAGIEADQQRALHRQATTTLAAAPQRAAEAWKVATNELPLVVEPAVLDMLESVAENAAWRWLPEVSLWTLLPSDLPRQ
ncbi:MAG TPA: hypothetical protein VFK45_05170 [Gammaproteobacteria bacterium]|nr:hypothetical protein [Gammaproteobacteria bacterium]